MTDDLVQKILATFGLHIDPATKYVPPNVPLYKMPDNASGPQYWSLSPAPPSPTHLGDAEIKLMPPTPAGYELVDWLTVKPNHDRYIYRKVDHPGDSQTT